MKAMILSGIFLLTSIAPFTFADEPKPKSSPLEKRIELNGLVFHLPPGFEIEQVAGPPLVNRPIVADFDDEGRLYVADSSGSNDNVKDQLQKKPHRVVRLECTKGNGRFDKATVFADQMMFPEGAMFLDGSLYVSAPPSIWKLTDTKGTGVADQRVEWFNGKTLTGCANDLHGPYAGPDGWIYWCKGAFAEQTYQRSGKSPFVTRAAHIFRARPDGSGIEPVMTGGMDNPVEVVFTPGGERIFTTTFFQHPGGGQRDGLIHAIYGGVYGKDHDVVYGHKWTSPNLMPVLTHLGPAAPAGLVRYESAVFGAEYQDDLFAALFNMHKVTRHRLAPKGATFASLDEDFLVCDHQDFHPTDVLEDADGSLLVIDTGGWYKLCCPTSQLHKPDVLGAIYRIRRKGGPSVADPRGLALDWKGMNHEDTARLLSDTRPAVRKRAIKTLAARGSSAIAPLSSVVEHSTSTEARRNALWAATKITNDKARSLVRKGLNDKDETIRQVALHSISLWKDPLAVKDLLPLLTDASLHNRRAAAEALGRIGDMRATASLLKALAKPVDRALDHSLTFALIEISDKKGTAEGLDSANPFIRKAALTALDQMDGGELHPESVIRELDAPEPSLRNTAWWIAARHMDWGGALIDYTQKLLKDLGAKEADPDELVRKFSRLAHCEAIQNWLAGLVGDSTLSAQQRKTVLRSMAAAGLSSPPESWLKGLATLINKGNPDLILDAVKAARALNSGKKPHEDLDQVLRKVGDDEKLAVETRLIALEAISGALPMPKPPLFQFLSSQLDRELPVANRGMAANILSRSQLSAEQLKVLTEQLKLTGPMEANKLMEAFAHSSDHTVGVSLIQSLKASPIRSSLRIAVLKQAFEKCDAEVKKQAEELYVLLNADQAKQKAQLEDLLNTLEAGDVRRGQAVFMSPKAACSSCHAVGYMGGTVGPDLTRIGSIRTERDFLESIVFPSASFVRGYEPVLVTTKAGRSHNGVIRRDAPDEIVLALDATHEVRIARADIEEIVPSKVSIMPAGLEQQLTKRELADVIAFLKACK